MTRRMLQAIRSAATTPAWAVHFHTEGSSGTSRPCFDTRCGLAPLATNRTPRG